MSELKRVEVLHMGQWVPGTVIPDPDAPGRDHPKFDVRLDRPDEHGRHIAYGKQFARGVFKATLRRLED